MKSVVIIDLWVENTSKKFLSIYLNQSTLITDSKEQVISDPIISDKVGGEFTNNMKKSGSVVFLLDTEVDHINSLNFIINAPFEDNMDKAGETIVFEFSNFTN